MKYSDFASEVCCVTVTYANRFGLLKQVVDSLIEQKIHKIIVVDNDSEIESKKKLEQLLSAMPETLKVIWLTENTGAAKGFKVGMEEALRLEKCNFIWLLDDDNLPQKDALSELMHCWNSINDIDKEYKVCLSCNRTAASGYESAAVSGNPDQVIGRYNSFWGFHFYDIPDKAIRKLNKNDFRQEKYNVPFGKIAVMPYGGLFLPKNIISRIGLPNTEYHIYVDDYEYTNRIAKNGGSLYLVFNSKIVDLQPAWESKSKLFRFYGLSKSKNYRNLYYTARNMTYFQRSFRTNNPFIFYINLASFSFLFAVFALPTFHIYNLYVFLSAITHGMLGRLGKVEKYDKVNRKT